jgi:ATP-binding cassette subfamily F protein 3
LAKRTIRIEAGKITNFAGDYDYYLWKSGSASARTGLVEGLRDARPDSPSKVTPEGKSLSAKERRRLRSKEREHFKAKRGKLEDSVRKLEKEIMELEEKQNEVNEQLADPQSYGDPEKAKELNEKASRIARHLKEKNYEWEIETEKLLELDE